MIHQTTISIKVCGMRDHANILNVAALKPGYLGFIFYARSPRFVGDDFQMPSVASSIKKVGVFVNEQNDVILQKTRRHKLDFIQLHGNESPEQTKNLKDRGLRIIKAFPVDDNVRFEKLKPFKGLVDYFLFDTKGKLYGGNAMTFDWNLLKRYDQDVPFFLSGGLTPANIDQLGDIEQMNIHALDFNSGVEEAPGLKDVAKVRDAFTASIRLKNNRQKF
jgi:phosphoribosylanthranilate isomerase